MIDVAHEEMLFFLALLAFSNVYQEAAGVGEFSAVEASVGVDEDMPDCPILRAQAYRVLDKLFIARQALERISHCRLFNVELGDVPPDKFIRRVSEHLQLLGVSPQDCAIGRHEMYRHV